MIPDLKRRVCIQAINELAEVYHGVQNPEKKAQLEAILKEIRDHVNSKLPKEAPTMSQDEKKEEKKEETQETQTVEDLFK
jgi:hypothetical protein